MRRRVGLRRWMLVLLAAAGCQYESHAVECGKVCSAADRCGFLPSALGGGGDPRQNCQARCEQTGHDPHQIVSKLRDCFSSVTDGVGVDDAGVACETSRQCLGDFLPELALGRASVRVRLQWLDDSLDIDEHCMQAGAAVGFYVQRGQTKERAYSRSCVDALTGAQLFEDLPPGIVHVGVELHTLRPNGDPISDADQGAPQEDCQTLYSDAIHLKAAAVSEVTLGLRPASMSAPLHCEQGEARCMNGSDDDGDGFVDCSDPDCGC